MESYEVLVLGGGTAGTAAASAASKAGARVAMFNKGELGGLCILRGCMPTKTLLHAAQLVHEARHHHTPGIGNSNLEVNFPAVMANKDAKVARFTRAKLKGIEAGSYEVIDAYARFSGPDTVETDDGRTFRFTRGAVLATGSDPVVPSIPGMGGVEVWTSDDALQLTELPESVIVLGGGAIGLELGAFLARMGTKVIQANRSRIYSKIDHDLANEMEQMLRSQPNITLVAPFQARRIEQQDEMVHLHVETDDGPRTLSAQHFIAATGRAAHLEGMGLEAAGVEHDRGVVFHDETMKTTNPQVYVAGDATGSQLLLHVANWEGKAAGLGAAGAPGYHHVEQRLKMSVIFTDPPLATIGKTEDEAREAGLPIAVAKAKLADTGRAITQDVEHGLWKIIAHQRTGELLGSQILGPRADDIIHVVSTAMYYHGKVDDLLEMPWYHPTLTEVLLSLARDLKAQVDPPPAP